MNEFAKTDRMLTEQFGVQAKRINGDELIEFDAALKPGLAGAFHYENDASVKPDLLLQQWTERLRERGVRLLSSARCLKSLARPAALIAC